MKLGVGVIEVLAVLTFLPIECDSGTMCLSCANIKKGETCQHLVTCKDEEVCFLQTYQTEDNQENYDVGCTYPELCHKDNSGHIYGRRRSHSHIKCQSCCNNTRLCNADLQCSEHLQVPRQKCFSCSDVSDSAACTNVTTCQPDEVCFLQKYSTERNVTLYDLGCKHTSFCLHGYTNPFGRRTLEGRHLLCETCCGDSNNCNRNLQCSHDKQKSFNSSCEATDNCANNMVCLAYKCRCPSTDYYVVDNTCHIRKSENGFCEETQQCQDSLQCKSNMCKCPVTTYWNGTNCELKKSYNDTCRLTMECNDTLFCIHGHCKCDHAVDFWTGTNCTARPLKPKECADIAAEIDGVYTIYPERDDRPVLAYCNMNSFPKWTVIQKRINGSVDFFRTWQEYEEGFGSALGEYWLGNDNIHFISSFGHHELSIYMELGNGSYRYANYTKFSVENENSKYVLHVSGYFGDAGGDSMEKVISANKADGQHFTTKDQDNDNSRGNCASYYQSAWWFSDCFASDLNRAYNGTQGQMYWYYWTGSISKSLMMIRRKF